MDKFTQLCKDLKSGDLSMTHISIALSAHYRQAEHLPEGIRNIIGGMGEGSGLIHKHFKLMSNTIGELELAYRRGNIPMTNDQKEI